MTKETLPILNTRTLIGFTDERGHAWHYRADEQGDEPNHYPLAVPVADVERRLFGWEALVGDVSVTVLTSSGVITVSGGDKFKGIIRPPKTFDDEDPGEILGIHSGGYQDHQFLRWLVDEVAILLDSELSIGSAGLLRDGKQAWVSIERPQTIVTPEDVAFRSSLLAASSHDASIASIWKWVAQKVVCDNTLAIGLRETSPEFRIKHTSQSEGQLAKARSKLQIAFADVDERFAKQVAELCAIHVNDPVWQQFLVKATKPAPGKDGKVSKRSLSMATRKREILQRYWDNDMRVAPWRNTAYGVIAAVNTYTHHDQTVRGVARPERNMVRAIEGGVDELDRRTLATLESVL